ncbi:MAG: carbamoyl phosphate synthase large subunit, partial [Dehalococcoidia bacterium]
MGVDYAFPPALAKALLAADLMLPEEGGVLLSIADRDKAEAVPIVRRLAQAGCRLFATEGTAAMIAALGIGVEMVAKRLEEGHPNVVDVIQRGLADVVINTPEGGQPTALRDGYQIRRAAAERRIPCFTSLDTARAAVDALLRGEVTFAVQPLREYLVGGQGSGS